MNGGVAPLDAAARVDVVAALAISRAAPLRFGVARAPAELAAVFRLRYDVVMDRGWAKPEEFPDALERDAFDERAIQIVAWDGETLVGTTRLVTPAFGQPLPTEHAFGLDLASRGRVIDMGRTCRAPGYKEAGQRVLWGILAQAWIETRAGGFTEICGSFTAAVARLYRRMGFRVELLGDARPYWGEHRYPVLIRPAESADGLRLNSAS